MTLRRLERETQISRNTLNRIENGLISPRLDDLEKIAEALGCAISDLWDKFNKIWNFVSFCIIFERKKFCRGG